VHGAGDQEKYLYFLTSGIVARLYVMENGASAEFAVTGSEGVIGGASFLGGESTPSQAVVLTTGYAYRLEVNLLKNEFEHGGLLPQLLLRYTQALITETGQTAVCNRHHSLEQQLCGWILSSWSKNLFLYVRQRTERLGCAVENSCADPGRGDGEVQYGKFHKHYRGIRRLIREDADSPGRSGDQGEPAARDDRGPRALPSTPTHTGAPGQAADRTSDLPESPVDAEARVVTTVVWLLAARFSGCAMSY